jgi:polysaccharide biosynthesis protein PslG
MSMRTSRLLVNAALVGSLALFGSGASSALAGLPGLVPCFGAQFHAGWSDYTDKERREVLDKLAAAGANWVRIDVGWASLQPRRHRIAGYYVDRIDEVVDEARERGLRVLATLWWTPSWANGGGDRAKPPKKSSDFARIARWVADHFRGRVSAWEIWNEPNHPDFFSGSPRRFAKLLKAAYPAIKEEDPSALVVSGGPAYNDVEWLRGVYEGGGGPYFDVLATHPYMAPADLPPETPDNGTKWTLRHVEEVRSLMRDQGDSDKPIWFTEFGWSSHRNKSVDEAWRQGVTEKKQAKYLVRTLKLVEKSYPYVTNLFWYKERNGASGDIHLDNYGLLERDLDPKPAYRSLDKHMGKTIGLPACSVPFEIVSPVEEYAPVTNPRTGRSPVPAPVPGRWP